MKKSRVMVVGSINQDIIFHSPVKSTEIGTIYDGYTLANGGKGNIQASAAAKLGADVVMVGCVGADDYGRNQILGLEELGVRTDCIDIRKDMPTGLAYVGLRPDGTYNSDNAIGANAKLSCGLVADALNRYPCDLIIMQIEMPIETVYGTYELAQRKQIPVILDPGPAQTIDLNPLHGIYLISPNEDETYALTGIHPDTPEYALQAAEIIDRKCAPQAIVLKLGGRGAYLYQNGKGELLPSFKVDAVDSTGAGDTFTAAMGLSLCEGMEIREAIRFANAAGAICVSRKGGQPSIPSMEEVRDWLKK